MFLLSKQNTKAIFIAHELLNLPTNRNPKKYYHA